MIEPFQGNHPGGELVPLVAKLNEVIEAVNGLARGAERVAQSANADVRHPMQPEFSHVRGCLKEEYPTARAALDRIERRMEDLLALPVPVGDETEALRALERLHERDPANGALDYYTIKKALVRVAGLERELEVLREGNERLRKGPDARVAGLEAREASLRDALREARRRRPPRMSIEAFERMIDAALADSGEAGS